jgi:hypothetical protein
MNEVLKELGEHITAAFGLRILSSEFRLGELMMRVERDAVVEVMRFLRDDASASSSCWSMSAESTGLIGSNVSTWSTTCSR